MVRLNGCSCARFADIGSSLMTSSSAKATPSGARMTMPKAFQFIRRPRNVKRALVLSMLAEALGPTPKPIPCSTISNTLTQIPTVELAASVRLPPGSHLPAFSWQRQIHRICEQSSLPASGFLGRTPAGCTDPVPPKKSLLSPQSQHDRGDLIRGSRSSDQMV